MEGHGPGAWRAAIALLVAGAALLPFPLIGLIGVLLLFVGALVALLAEAFAVRAAARAAESARAAMVLGRGSLSLLGSAATTTAILFAPFGFLADLDARWEVSTYRLPVPYAVLVGPSVSGSLFLPLPWLAGAALIATADRLYPVAEGERAARYIWALAAPAAALSIFRLLAAWLPLSV